MNTRDRYTPNIHETNYNYKIVCYNLNKNTSIPFFGQISQQIKHMLKQYDTSSSFRNNSSFKQCIKLGKDTLNINDQSNLVYKINCETCRKSYVGGAKKLLKTRCNEHKNNNIKLNSKYHIVITKDIIGIISGPRTGRGHFRHGESSAPRSG